MRLLLFAFSTAIFLVASASGPITITQAQECTGKNCPQPGGQGSGRDCEHNKENTVS